MSSEGTGIRTEPLFFKSSDVPQENNRWLTLYETCKACSFVANPENNENKKKCIEEAQIIGILWRVYLNDETARVSLLSQGITLRGQQVELKERNPYFMSMEFEHYDTTRLFIRNVPLSFDNTEIENALKKKGVHMVNQMEYSRARDPNGKLTNFKTGDKFVDFIVPDEALPKKLSVGIFNASLYHKEQKQAVEDKECGNCMLTGHLRKDCPNEIVCYDFRQAGHKKGDPECPSMEESFEDARSNAHSDSASESSKKAEGEEAHVSEDDYEKSDKNVSQMLKEVLATEENAHTTESDLSKPVGRDKQSPMTSFVSGSIHTGQPSSRSSSPAGRRKLAYRRF